MTAGSVAESHWWASPVDQVMIELGTTPGGLTAEEAADRLSELGPNQVQPRQETTAWTTLLGQFRSPLVLILVAAAVISGVVSEWLDAIIIFAIVIGSGMLGFFQEYRASNAVAELQARVELRVRVRRDGKTSQVRAAELVPGDIVILSTGGLVPADGLVLAAADCQVSEAILTGETFPTTKTPGVVAPDTPLSSRANCVWMGTTVRTGTAEMVTVATGIATRYGAIARHLASRPPETAFEKGLRQFGHLLTQFMVILVLVVFSANVFLDKPSVDSLLFAIALAVGIAPELLPVIMAINLAHGARRMAELGVIVRRLSAIENLGSMEILCTDKTGTLTEGAITLDGGYDPDGGPAEAPIVLGVVNASLQAGLVGPLDQALLSSRNVDGWEKIAEIPFDFFRKRLSVVARHGDDPPLMICKGALKKVLDICDTVGLEVARPLGSAERDRLTAWFEDWSREGWRVLGVAAKPTDDHIDRYTSDDEKGMSFVGFLRFSDPPKADAAAVIDDLDLMGVEVKVISGDVAEVTAHLAVEVGLKSTRILTGAQINSMSDEALWHVAARTNLFVEVDPTHKERIVSALRHGGRVVGFMGDGVNDAPALHAADVGISVDSAVDVAREAASFVLLRHDLRAVRDGIVEGRRTFANTMKYIATTESANFGNMLSMAAASFFLPFLPLTATQVLLNNFLSDFPATTIATDRVDPETVARPERWDIGDVRLFMIVFGAVSSFFDFITFGLLLSVFSASEELFRTGWFVESLLTELVIALVVRTRRPFFRSRPSRLLAASSAAVAALTFALPYLPFAHLFGFVTPTPALMFSLTAVTFFYVIATEATKRILARRLGNGLPASEDRVGLST